MGETDKLKKKISDLEDELKKRETEFARANEEVEKNRTAMLFLLEDLESTSNQVKQAHQEWIDALDGMNDPIFLHDQDFKILRCNKAYQKCTGKNFKEIIGKPYYKVFPKLDKPDCCKNNSLQNGKNKEDEIIEEGNEFFRLRYFPVNGDKGEYLYSVHILENITDKKHSEEAFRTLIDTAVANTGEAFFHEIVSSLSKWMEADCVIFGELVEDNMVRARSMLMDGKFIEKYEYNLPGTPCNNVASKGYCVYNESVSDLFPDDKDLRGMNAQSYVGIPVRDNNKGMVNSILCAIFRRKLVEPPMLKGVLEIISARASAEIERLRAEKAVNGLNQTLSALSSVNRFLVKATDEEDLLSSICQTIVQHRDYDLAWVGYVNAENSGDIEIKASAGHNQEFLNYIDQAIRQKKEDFLSPCHNAIKEGETQVESDLSISLALKDIGKKYGILSRIVLPLKDIDNKVFGILGVYSSEAHSFHPDEVNILDEMAEDLAFGVRSLRVRVERDQALEENRLRLVQIEESLEETVRAMASIVELRDPYTAGHQARVANLAAEIAKKMKLSGDVIQSIHIAGALHDLGKIQVPAEILSKPGKISELDYNFIKTHSQAGYDILKKIQFPWPVADIVVQHHEKLDGSGYPNGLKGKDIRLEARILCVADVVEAMSSHRPYRPGLGIDTALKEVIDNKGILFDEDVVDCVVELFRKDNFQFSS